MDDEVAIQDAARRLIGRFGEAAAAEARIRAEELRAAGDADGFALWKAISAAVRAMIERGTQQRLS